MDVGNGEIRSPQKKLSLGRGYKSSFRVMLGCSGGNILRETMWYIRVSVSPALG